MISQKKYKNIITCHFLLLTGIELDCKNCSTRSSISDGLSSCGESMASSPAGGFNNSNVIAIISSRSFFSFNKFSLSGSAINAASTYNKMYKSLGLRRLNLNRLYKEV